MTFVWTALKLLIVIGVVATIHEIGHFLFAKLFKMKVDEFGIGFGKAIFKKEYKGTIYSIRCLPLGGYVAIDGEDGESQDENAFSKKSPFKRIIVLIAGATFNAILAFAIFIGVNFSSNTYTTQIKEFTKGSILQEAGIKENDTITKIENTKTNIYSDIANFNNYNIKDIVVEYKRGNDTLSTVIKEAVKDIGYAGIYFDTDKLNNSGDVLSEVEVTDPGSASSKAGIKSKDIIKEINGTKVSTAEEVIKFTSENANKELNFVILRAGKEIKTKVTPKKTKSIDFGISQVTEIKTNLKYSYYKSMSTIKQIVGSYIELFQGKVKVQQLSGIVGIGEVVSRADGFKEFINLLGIISLAIGVANMLPFTPLDGGRIILVLAECITRKKVPPKLDMTLNYIGFILLILLTIYVTINDIIRIV